MWQFAKQKTTDIWGGIRGDMIATLVVLLVAYLVSIYDFLNLKTHPSIGETGATLIYFGATLVVGYSLTRLWFVAYSLFFRYRIRIDIRVDTNPGRKVFGRYLGIFIRNKSIGELEHCFVVLKNVDAVKSKWKPPKVIVSGYPLLWGSVIPPREGSKKIIRNKAVIADILHTDDKTTGGRIYFTQQHIGEIINAPVGKYLIDLEIIGTHLGQEFNIPFSFAVKFNGGMDIDPIKPNQIDNHVSELSFTKDGIDV